jgi:Fe-S-cluster-containing hydrogenase component 2
MMRRPQIQRSDIMVKKFLAINLERCTGCRNCELACSLRHTTTFNPKRARIQILKDEPRNLIVPMVCLQCETPLCKDACPNNAIKENDSGVLYVDHEVCIGCGNCVTACTYGGIEIDPLTRKAIKCDLCDGDPACVKACDYGAITLVTDEKSGYIERRKALDAPIEKLGLLIKEGSE